jgi:NADPH-dependent glutamate synthase beta subunit-like oxidoreductase
MIIAPFYSINENLKHPANRVYHNNNACPSGRDIPEWERQSGTGGYRWCENCQKAY